MRQRVAHGNRGGEEHQRDGQADAAPAEQLAQLTPRPDGALAEEFVDRVAQEGRLLGRAGGALEMDDQRERRRPPAGRGSTRR